VGWLGRAQMQEGHMDEARTTLQEALALARAHRSEGATELSDARLNLAEWHLRAGQPAEAAALLAELAPALPFKDGRRAERHLHLQGQLQAQSPRLGAR
jgi:thioredoxin-like negative regulator of GroEL